MFKKSKDSVDINKIDVSAEDEERFSKALSYLEKTDEKDVDDEDVMALASNVTIQHKDRKKTKIESLGLGKFCVYVWMMHGSTLSITDYKNMLVKEQKRRDIDKAWDKTKKDELVTNDDVKEFLEVLVNQHPIVLQTLFMCRRADVEAMREIVDDFSLLLARIKSLYGLQQKLLSEGKHQRYLEAQKVLNSAQELYYKYTKEIKQRVTVDTLETHLDFILNVIRDAYYINAAQKEKLFDDIANELRKSSTYFSESEIIEGTFEIKD